MSSGKFWRALLKLGKNHDEVVKLWNGYLGILLGELKARVKDSKGQPFKFPKLSPVEIARVQKLPGVPKPDEFVQTGMDFFGLNFKDHIDCSGLVFWQANFNKAIFSGEAGFSGASFSGEAYFYKAKFYGEAGFSGANFYGEAYFNKASFYGGANFRDTSFSGEADFAGASFDGDADFAGASFDGDADFESASFSNLAYFRDASFDGYAGFNKARFSGGANFWDARFDGEAFFTSASFDGDADFRGTRFSEKADFHSASFDCVADFHRAKFSEYTNFRDVSFSGKADFHSASFSEYANFKSASFYSEADFREATFSYSFIVFYKAKFRKTTFFNKALFDHVTFKGKTSFDEAKFKQYPPSFHGATLHQDTGFLDTEWPKTPARLDEERSEIDYGRRAWERLAQIMSEQNRYHDASRFAIEEMRWRRMLQPKWSLLTFVNWLYEQTCGYGYALDRALCWWLWHIMLGGISLSSATVGSEPCGRIIISSIWPGMAVSLSNSLAVFGLGRSWFEDYQAKLQYLAKQAGNEHWLNIISALQMLTGAILLFLLLLTLRRRFRMR